MKTIKKIDGKSLARLCGVLYAILGFIMGIFVSLAALFSGNNSSGFMSAVFGIGGIILLPILYGLMGLVGGYISAWAYNFMAKKVGGIQIEVE